MTATASSGSRRSRTEARLSEVAAGEQAEDEPERDAADQHGRGAPWFTAASCGGERGASRRSSAGSTGGWPASLSGATAGRRRRRSDPIGRRAGRGVGAGGRHPVGGLGDERDLARARRAGPGPGRRRRAASRTKASTTTGSNWTPGELAQLGERLLVRSAASSDRGGRPSSPRRRRPRGGSGRASGSRRR